MAMNHYFLAGATVPGGQINQMQDQDLDPQTQEMVEGFDGQVDASFAAVMTQRPTMRLTSTALALVLGTIGTGGLAYDAATGGSSAVDFYYQPAVPGGTRDTTKCVRCTSGQGMIVLDSIDANEGSIVQCGLMAYCNSSNGVLAPMAMSTNVALPTPLMTRENFTVGPVKVNGTLIGGVISTRLRFGLQITHECEDGNAYPTLAYIAARRAVLTIRTRNVNQVATLGLHAAQSGASKTTAFFRKLAAGGTRVADATAQHVSVAASSGIILVRNVPASQGQPAAVDLEIPITSNGTDANVIVNPATAIS